MEQRQLIFPPFQIDRVNERVWHSTVHGTSALRLRPKTFAVLCYLVERTQQLVTKDQLLDALWAETCVSDSALKSCIRELRAALSDDPKAPQFIETVHRRGYRFIASLTITPPQVSGSRRRDSGLPSQPTPDPCPPIPTLAGREAELSQLHGWLAKALNGERQMVFIAGEAGIGKTTLIEAFLFGVRSRERFGVQEQEESQKSKRKSQKSKVEASSLVPSP